MGELTKLKQTTTVREYQEQFELLANKTQNLPESFFTSCFISGLKEEIKANVLMFRPTYNTQAIGLAKLQEHSIEAISKKTRQNFKVGESMISGQSRNISHSGILLGKNYPRSWRKRRQKGCVSNVMRGILEDTDVRRNNYCN